VLEGMQKDNESVTAYVDRSYAAYLESCRLGYSGVGKSVVVRCGPASCGIVFMPRFNSILLTGLVVEQESLYHGHGGRLLDEIIAWADSKCLDIGLQAFPYPRSFGGLWLDALVGFYQRRGFVAVGRSGVGTETRIKMYRTAKMHIKATNR